MLIVGNMKKDPKKMFKATKRNWTAVAAHFRNSAGPMENIKKKREKIKCRETLKICNKCNNDFERCICPQTKSAKDFCDVCGCDPCDCHWGDY